MAGFLSLIGNGLKKAIMAVKKFVRRHVKLVVFLLVAVVGGLGGFAVYSNINAGAAKTVNARPETTMLKKMNLEQTVTASGTLQSANSRDVTSDLSYDIAQVNVAEGDKVKQGQQLAVVDSTSIDKNIAEVKKKISEAEKSDSLALAQLERKLQDAINQYNLDEGRTAGDVQKALESLNTANTDRDTAQALKNKLEKALEKAKENLQNYPPAGDENHDPAKYTELQRAETEAQTSYDKAVQDYETKKNAASQAQTTYENAVQQRDSTVRQSSIGVENARDAVENQKLRDSAESYRTQLEDYLEEKEKCVITAPISGTVTSVSAEVGSGAGGTAAAANTGAGTAAAGNTGSGSSLFTIEDMSRLEIPLSIAEYDAINLSTKMAARISTDAVEDKTWSGSVTGISAVAADGYFTVDVQISSNTEELVAGMSATADIILESRDNVYAVPFDAVVTNAQGETVVYALEMPARNQMGRDKAASGTEQQDKTQNTGRQGNTPAMPGAAKQGGNTDMAQNRKEIVVETGFESDYYIEISGEGLEDGLLILNDPLGLNVKNTSETDTAGNLPRGGRGNGGTALPGGGGFPGGGRPPQ